MAEVNQSCQVIARMLQNISLLDDEDIRPQQQPIAPSTTNIFCASPSSSSPYSVYHNPYLQNSSPINGGFPSQSWNNGGFSPLSWNTGGNAVDWSYCDTSSKYVNPCALPSIGNYERVGRINSPVSSWNNYLSPTTRFNRRLSDWTDFYNPTTICTTDSTNKAMLEAKRKAMLEVYNKMKIAEFKNYLKLIKRWTEEHIQNFERCDNPSLLHEFCGIDIHMMCMNQLGSVYLQRVIQSQPSATTVILDAVLMGIFEVASDPYGYYVFNKLVDHCSQEQLKKIVYALTNRDASNVFIAMVMTENGTKSIQKLISTLKGFKPLIKNVINSIKPHVLELMLNQSGRRLIDHCMKSPNHVQTQFIYETVVRHCLELARHKEGYHVVSKAIETAQDPYRMQILTVVTNHAVHLAQEPNGNFVLQKVIGLENPVIIFNLCFNLKEKVVPLSKTKHGSHVIEKCLMSSAVVFVVKEILSSKELIELAQNEFGNYVLQKALENLKDKHHKLYMELLSTLKALSKLLENHQYGIMVLKCMRELEIQLLNV